MIAERLPPDAVFLPDKGGEDAVLFLPTGEVRNLIDRARESGARVAVLRRPSGLLPRGMALVAMRRYARGTLLVQVILPERNRR